MSTYRLDEYRCTECDTLLDAVTSMVANTMPKPGDVTLCAYCAHTMEFDENLNIKTLDINTLTDEEKAVIANAKVKILLGEFK